MRAAVFGKNFNEDFKTSLSLFFEILKQHQKRVISIYGLQVLPTCTEE